MSDVGAVKYLKTKLASHWQLPMDAPLTPEVLSSKLPLSFRWLQHTQSQVVPDMQQSLGSARLLDVDMSGGAAVAGSPSSGLPLSMRTGLSLSPGAHHSSASQAGTSTGSLTGLAAVQPMYPVGLLSWQGAFRAGLVDLVSSDAPAVGAQLPELLTHDKERLHAAQNGLQQLIVMASGLLIVQQLRQAAGLWWTSEDKVAARRRLYIVLSDPGMKLTDLVTEISQLAGSSSLSAETQVKNMFMTLVNPESSSFKALKNMLCVVLLTCVLHGPDVLSGDSEAARAAASALARAGASALVQDVASLAGKLADIAAVNEAVHGDILAVMLI